MKKNISILMASIITIIALTSGCATSGKARQETAAPGPVTVKDVRISDNLLEIEASGPFAYAIYKPSDPYRITIDIPDVAAGQFREKIVSRSAGITEVLPSQTESPKIMTTMEVLLQSPSEVEPVYRGNVLALRVREGTEQKPDLKDETPADPPGRADTAAIISQAIAEEKVEVKEIGKAKEEPQGQRTAPVKKEAPLPKATEITEISFDQKNGVVSVIIKGDGVLSPTVFTLKDRIVIDIPDTALKARVPSTLISPVKGLRAGRHREKTRLVLDMREMKQFDVASVGNTVTVAIKGAEPAAIVARSEAPPVPQKQEMPEKRETPAAQAEPKKPAVAENSGVVEAREPEAIVEGRYAGKKISLDFQDADIVPIFRLLSDISGYNIVVSPEVKGRLTMKLINVPWDQALDLILKTFSLGKSVEDNIIRIAPHAVFAKESEEKARAKEAEVKAEPLETKIYPVSYAKVEDVQKAIKDSRLLSSRGSISVDTRTSSMVIKDVGSVFPSIENLLATLDKPTPQVMIEARIVEVNVNDATNLGVQWGFKLNTTDTLFSAGGIPTLNSGTFTGNNFLVDLPSGATGAGSGSGFNFGLLNPSKTLGLDFQLDALEKIGKSKIISRPRIVTTDNDKALIMQGTSEPYPVLTTEGTISTAFKDVALSAEVVPHITPAGSVSMTVLVKKEDILERVNIGGSQVPRTSKIEGNTKVLVQNGETLVIGGVYKKTESENVSGVPGLMKIPVLGWLFKNKGTTETTSELLIFITPRIVEAPEKNL